MTTLVKPPVALDFSILPPLSLYIHFPWCLQKCPYCDFNSHTYKNQSEADYLDGLMQDLYTQLPSVWGRELSSIFIGGGTPSLLSAEGLDHLLSQVRAVLPFNDTLEVTLEANPGTFERDKFMAYRQAGITRLSLGVQSFDNALLKSLGRIHSADEAHAALETIAGAGFRSWNLDVMFGLPQQTHDQALEDVRQALSYDPPHFSYYQLTLEPNTPFYAKPPQLPDEDDIADAYEQAQQFIAQQGLQQYEVSAYAKPHQACQHNVNYWQFGDYLGIGAGAHGKISRADLGQVVRTERAKSPAAYMQEVSKPPQAQILSPQDLVFEFALNALRLKEGVPLSLCKTHTGLDAHHWQEGILRGQMKGYLQKLPYQLQTTALGWRFLNDVQSLFLPKS